MYKNNPYIKDGPYLKLKCCNMYNISKNCAIQLWINEFLELKNWNVCGDPFEFSYKTEIYDPGFQHDTILLSKEKLFLEKSLE